MAKMKAVSFDVIREKGSAVKVGNNRTVEYSPADRVFVGRLHGHPIFEISDDKMKVCLDTCGYSTTTTRQAMNDFFDFFNLSGSVSFAKGLFTVNVYGQTVSRGDTRIITVSC